MIYDNGLSEKKRPIVNLVCMPGDTVNFGETEERMEDGVKLVDYIPAYSRLVYTYDFGDDWKHDIEVERILDDYEHYISALDDPTHLTEWGSMQQPIAFEILFINGQLKSS